MADDSSGLILNASGYPALRARTNFPQKLPRIQPQIVIIVPFEPDRVFAHGLSRHWFCRRLEHRQRSWGKLRWITRFASGFIALLVAHRAWASVAEVDEIVVRNVAVRPLDIHTRAGRKVNFYGLWIGSSAGGLKRGLHDFSIAQQIRVAPRSTSERSRRSQAWEQ